MIIDNITQLKEFNKKHGIYRFKNKNTDWNYIGETNNLLRRTKEHKRGKGKHYIDYFIKQYGLFETFEIELLHWWDNPVSKLERLALETAYIIEYDSLVKNGHGYNIVLVGSEFTVPKGFKHSEISKLNMSISKEGKNNGFFGKHHTEETKEKNRNTWKQKYQNGYINPCKGITLKPERIEKQRLKILGTKQSEDTKNKRSETFKTLYKNGYKNPMIGRIISKEEKAKYSQKVKQIDKNTGEVIKIWDSITEASNNMGFKSKNSIRQASQPSKRKSLFKKSAGGFYWEYV